MPDLQKLLAASPALQSLPKAIRVHVERMIAHLPEAKRQQIIAMLQDEQMTWEKLAKEAKEASQGILVRLKGLEAELDRLIREAEESQEQKQTETVVEKLLQNS